MEKLLSAIIIFLSLVAPSLGGPAGFVRSFGHGQLNNPYRIAVSGGCVFAVDTANDQVRKFGPDGKLIYSIAGFNGGDHFRQPQGVAADAARNLYVIDTGNHRIVKLRDNGPGFDYLGLIASLPDGSGFKFPRSGAVDGDGNLYVVDTANDRVVKFPAGEVLGGRRGGLSALGAGDNNAGLCESPYGVTIADGSIYVADTKNDRVKKYSFDKELLLAVGGRGRQEGKLLAPCDVAVDPAGNIYVADTENHRVQKFDKSGKFVLAFGRLFAPRGLFFDRSSGYLYVTGADNQVQAFDVSLHLTELSISNGVISPNAGEVRLEFCLSEAAQVSINIMNAGNDALIRDLAKGQVMPAGKNSFYWGGTDNSGKIVADGAYNITIAARTVDGKKDAVPVLSSVEVDGLPPIFKVQPPVVGRQEKTGTLIGAMISYEVSERARVRLEVFSGDRLVYQAEQEADGASSQQFFWDGKDLNGQPVKPRPKYDFRLTASDPAGNAGVCADQIVLDATPPEIKNLILAPYCPTVVSFEVSDNLFEPLSGLRIVVLDKNNVVIKVLREAGQAAAGLVQAAWDGKDEMGNMAPDGVYRFRISVRDGAGNEAVRVREVTIDTVPPRLAFVQNIPAFSPNGDGRFDSVDYCLRSSEDGRIFFQVSGAGLTPEALSVSAEAGREVKLTWDQNGPGRPGVKYPDGDYLITVKAIDQAGNVAKSVTARTRLDTTPPVILTLTATPDPFTPNDDGQGDTAKFEYRFSEPVSARLDIFGESGGLFRSFEGTAESWAWDGRGERNELIGGTYTYRLTARDGVGNMATSETKAITVDRASALISYACAVPDPFAPANPDNNFTEIRYFLGRDGLTVKAEIIGPGGRTAKTLVSGEVQGKGEHSVIWRGDLDQGYLAGDGSYCFKITAGSAEASGTVLVDNLPPQVLIKELKVDSDQKIAALVYTVPETVSLEADLCDHNGNWLRRLATAETKVAGDYRLSCGLSGEAAVCFQLTAVDRAKNRSETRSAFIGIASGELAAPAPGTVPGTVELTVNPGSFSTNANPDGSDRPRSCTLCYRVGKATRVSVRVHKVDGDLVATLADNASVEANIWQSVIWDGKIAGELYAGPGQYVFVVSGECVPAGRAVVSIQNNVLTLQEPGQLENPVPHYISPGGSSLSAVQKRARIFFLVPVGLTPLRAASALPTKAVGKYSVRVFGDRNLTALVRTITAEAAAQSASLTYEDWDGKDEAGRFAADGTYYINVILSDFAGVACGSLTRSVEVDNTAPTISSLEASHRFFSAGTRLTYSLTDNDPRVTARIAILKDGAETAILRGDDWQGEGYRGDGLYTFRVTAVDSAGNFASAEGQAVIDRAGPEGTIKVNEGATYALTTEVILNLWSTDETSGVSEMCFSADGDNWTSWEAATGRKNWRLTDGDGVKDLFVRFADRAGNYHDYAGTIILDTVPPCFTAGPDVSGAPVNAWTTAASPAFGFAAADATAGIKEVHGYVDGVDQGALDAGAAGWQPRISDGVHALKLRVYDKAGHYCDSPEYTFKVDTVKPAAPSVSLSNSTSGGWTRQNRPIFAWADPGDGGGSGVSHYRGYIDGTDQGVNIGSGWQPTLGDGTHRIWVKAYDAVGWASDNSNSFVINVDTQGPYLSQPGAGAFNPYVEGSAAVAFTAYDQGAAGIASFTARVKYGTNLVKDLPVINDGGCNYHINWDGRNNAGDYENEGDYSLEISASDSAGNSAAAASTITLRDNLRIDHPGIIYAPEAGPPSMTYPGLFFSGNTLTVKWIEPSGQYALTSPDQGRSWTNLSAAGEYKNGPEAVNSNQFRHSVFAANGNLFYERRSPNGALVGSAQLTRSNDVVSQTLSLVVDNDNNCYVSWQSSWTSMSGTAKYSVYFQKIPVNFAPVTGTRLGAQSVIPPVRTATAETLPLTAAPQLTLTGVTNYPNPFNPNKEKTKLRYWLSIDAEETKIRIYDINGALVKELDGTTRGEGPSIWDKYNDVEWDGRNGRGMIVPNGVYPFEVTARLGERSVSGRGRIAVLK